MMSLCPSFGLPAFNRNGLSAGSPARPEVDEGRKVPEKTERVS